MPRPPVKIIALLLASLLFANCSRPPETQVAKRPPRAVEVEEARPAPLVDELPITGTLSPKFEAEVKTQIPGLIEEVYVREWVKVHKGQPLAKINAAETAAAAQRAKATWSAARAALAQAQAEGEQAERERQRTQELKEAGLATRKQADDATSAAQAASARTATAQDQAQAAEEEWRQAQARLAKALVLSPLDGVVAQRHVNVGDLASDASSAKPIFVIVDNRLLDLTATVPSSSQAQVATGQEIVFHTEALPGQNFHGQVAYVNPRLELADRSLRLVAQVNNGDGPLKGGMFVSGQLIVDRRPAVLQVPRSALDNWEMAKGRASLLVIEGGLARRRQVTTGQMAGDQVEIRSGLAPGEPYVPRGGFTLKDGDPVRVVSPLPNQNP